MDITPLGLVILLSIGLVPTLFWMFFFYRLDHHREPVSRIVIFIVLGGLATIPALIVETIVELAAPGARSDLAAILIGSFLIVAPIEEFIKYLVVRFAFTHNRYLDEPVDGIVYAVAVGLGFATVENFFVLSSGTFELLVMRFATATLLHALTAGFMGYFLTKQFFGKKSDIIGITGLVVAVALHGLYNSLVQLQNSSTFYSVVILLVVAFVVLFTLSSNVQRATKPPIQQ